MERQDELKSHGKLMEAVKLDDPRAGDALWMYLEYTVLRTFTQTLERFGIKTYPIISEVTALSRDRIKSENSPSSESSFLAWVRELARNTAIEYYRNTRSRDEADLSQPSVRELEEALGESDFTLYFSSHLSVDQVVGTLEALADYYRACGGVGFQVDLDSVEVSGRELPLA